MRSSNGALEITAQDFKGWIYKGFSSFLLHSLVTKIKNIELRHFWDLCIAGLKEVLFKIPIQKKLPST